MNALAYSNQDLKSHLINTSNIALKYSGQYYAEVCARRISYASRKEFSPQQFIQLVRIAAAFHDAGKAADRYQMQFVGQACKEPSFHLHEIPSAIIAKNLMKEAGYDVDSILLVSLAVLFHHTAMRPYGSQEAFLSSRSNYWTFSKFKDDIDDLSADVLKTRFSLSRIDNEDAKSFMAWVKDMTGNSEKSRFAKLYCLVLGPVIYGDNIDAKSRRSDNKKRLFVEELEETLNG